jgi:hypothetical protein
MMHQRRIDLMSLTLALSASVSACQSATATAPDTTVQSIAVSVGVSGSRLLTLNKNEPVTLTVVARGTGGQTVQPVGDFTYVSRSPAIATASATGIVTGRSAGSTYVVVSLPIASRILTDSIQVTVVLPTSAVAVALSSSTATP